MNWQDSETITFEEAIDFTHSLLEKMEANQIKESEIQSAITSLVKTENGARGFFVTYLTDNRPIVDKPSKSEIEALKTSPTSWKSRKESLNHSGIGDAICQKTSGSH